MTQALDTILRLAAVQRANVDRAEDRRRFGLSRQASVLAEARRLAESGNPQAADQIVQRFNASNPQNPIRGFKSSTFFSQADRTAAGAKGAENLTNILSRWAQVTPETGAARNMTLTDLDSILQGLGGSIESFNDPAFAAQFDTAARAQGWIPSTDQNPAADSAALRVGLGAGATGTDDDIRAAGQRDLNREFSLGNTQLGTAQDDPFTTAAEEYENLDSLLAEDAAIGRLVENITQTLAAGGSGDISGLLQGEDGASVSLPANAAALPTPVLIDALNQRRAALQQQFETGLQNSGSAQVRASFGGMVSPGSGAPLTPESFIQPREESKSGQAFEAALSAQGYDINRVRGAMEFGLTREGPEGAAAQIDVFLSKDPRVANLPPEAQSFGSLILLNPEQRKEALAKITDESTLKLANDVIFEYADVGAARYTAGLADPAATLAAFEAASELLSQSGIDLVDAANTDPNFAYSAMIQAGVDPVMANLAVAHLQRPGFDVNPAAPVPDRGTFRETQVDFGGTTVGLPPVSQRE